MLQRAEKQAAPAATAEKADFHLAIKPGTDAWCLAALVAILVQEGLVRPLDEDGA